MDKKINERLKQFRESKKLTQKEVAKEIGVNTSYLSDLETGRRNITGRIIEKLQKKYFLSSDWMYTGKGEMFINLVYPKNVPSHVPLDTIKSLVTGKKRFEELTSEETKALYEYWDNEHKISAELNGNQPSGYYNKFSYEVFKTERPDLAELNYTLSEISAYSLDLEKINLSYFEDAFNPINNNIKNYSDYKSKNINKLESYLKYLPAIKPLAAALKKFMETDFPPLDDKGLLAAE